MSERVTKEQFIALEQDERQWRIFHALESLMHESAKDREDPEPTRNPNARAPKYDHRIRRQGGFVWASEMLLDDLEYWFKRNSESTDAKWADKNKKDAAKLKYWVDYRRAAPLDRWTGQRGDVVVTAAAPNAAPVLRDWDEKPSESVPAETSAFTPGAADDDDIPFSPDGPGR